jgi:hypothetical protein
MSAAGWKIIRLRPEIGDPGNPAIVLQIKEAQARQGSIRHCGVDPAGGVLALADDLLQRNVPVIAEAVHVEPDLGVPAADLLRARGAR